MKTIPVTPEQVEAAQLEVATLEAAGLRPDPLVRLLANATPEGTEPSEAEIEELVRLRLVQNCRRGSIVTDIVADQSSSN